MIAKIPKSSNRSVSTVVFAQARVRNAVYVYRGHALRGPVAGTTGSQSAAASMLSSSSYSPSSNDIDPITLRRRSKTAAKSTPLIDETVYKATEAARVSKWLSRFSAGDPGSVQLPMAETKPGLQVHMRPPVFDKRVFEATEALNGGDKVTKHAASPRNAEVKAKTIPASAKSKAINEATASSKSELGSKDNKSAMFEPVYDDTYPLNAQTATGHEVNRSLLDNVDMIDRSSIATASEVSKFDASSVKPSEYPTENKMVRDEAVLEATEDVAGSHKMKVYTSSGKRKIKIEHSKTKMSTNPPGTQDATVFAATEKLAGAKKLERFAVEVKTKPVEAKPAVGDEVISDKVYHATEVLAREFPLPRPSPRAGSDEAVFNATEHTASSGTVEKFSPGQEPQHLAPKAANFDMITSALPRAIPRQFFGTGFPYPARDGKIFRATEALEQLRRSSSSSVPPQILADPNIAIDRQVLEATERLAAKKEKLRPVESIPQDDGTVASLDEPITTGGFRPIVAAKATRETKPSRQASKSEFTSWNPPSTPSSSLSDPPHRPLNHGVEAAKNKEDYYGGFESGYDRDSLSDPFLYAPRQLGREKVSASTPPLVIPDNLLHEARTRLVQAYSLSIKDGKKPTADELLATAAGSPSISSVAPGPFVLKTPSGVVKTLKAGEEIDGFKLVGANEEAVQEVMSEAKEAKKRTRRRSMLWSAVWVGGLSAGLAFLAEEGKKAGAKTL